MASYDELIYDPIGHLFDQQFQRGAYGGHQTHVHIALAKHPRLLLSLLLWARRRGLHIGENPWFGDPVDPVHTQGSFHYQTFGRKFRGRTLGKAADVTGSPAQMARFFRVARRHLLSGNRIGGNVGAFHGGRPVPQNPAASSAILSALLNLRASQAPMVSPARQLASLQAASGGQRGYGLSPDAQYASDLDEQLKALRKSLLA